MPRLRAMFLAVVVGACGGDGGGNDVANPTLIPGGGVGEGAIDGEVNVFAVDNDTGEPIAGASVRVGEPEEASPKTGVTDGSGLVTFTGVGGPQTITVTADGYAAATWFGANGAVVTIPLTPDDLDDVPAAQVSGTIEGWSDLPAPADQHYRIAIVLYSWSEDFGDRANNIQQPSGTGGFPANVCAYIPGVATGPCEWEMNVRTGPQAHYAIIYDADSNGTPFDPGDDIFEITGFAIKTSLDLAEGENITGEVLTMVADTDMVDATVALGQAPSGLDTLGAIPLIDLGEDGQLPIIYVPVPGEQAELFTPDRTTSLLPALSGDLAGGTYSFFARAYPSNGDAEPNSNLFVREADIGATVNLPTFPAVPTNLDASQGTYSFTAASGAAIHTGQFRGTDGTAWTFALLDGRTSLTLPTLEPDPLPAGDVTLSVSAFFAPGFDPTDFSGDEAFELVTGVSTNALDFSR